MDLLGSILGSMDASKPNPPSEKEKLMKKKQKELVSKMEEKHREAKLKFRTKVETQINDFLKKENEKTLKFSAMDQYHRSVVHDVSEIAGLVTYSFGEEDVDRHIQVWKKEFSPCEGELAALRRGEEWDPVKEKLDKEEREWREKLEVERSRTLNQVTPKTNYHSKYEHLIGLDSALDAAKKTETNAQYGMVSAEEKKDRRTVEDIQAELRAKKKQKVDHV
eukprot:TRINITY_DN5016_c0_g1_i2.p1 TRINITY_DN5016_c0_g1~~TRINITY_DN5016_c0_g1_i2.p1  ORF type:complete len:221 (+),score=83.58 TRINITY_DN5016_c0_g1_i2:52-714(+)